MLVAQESRHHGARQDMCMWNCPITGLISHHPLNYLIILGRVLLGIIAQWENLLPCFLVPEALSVLGKATLTSPFVPREHTRVEGGNPTALGAQLVMHARTRGCMYRVYVLLVLFVK